jgi:hypothetical protein
VLKAARGVSVHFSLDPEARMGRPAGPLVGYTPQLNSERNETRAKRGLCCFHAWIPLLKCVPQFVVEYMSTDLKKQMCGNRRTAASLPLEMSVAL